MAKSISALFGIFACAFSSSTLEVQNELILLSRGVNQNVVALNLTVTPQWQQQQTQGHGLQLNLPTQHQQPQLTSPIPTTYQAASIAKQLLHRNGVGTVMVAVDPSGQEFGKEYADFPYGQVELIAQECDTTNKNRDSLLMFSSELEITTRSWNNYRNNVTIHVREFNDDSKSGNITMAFDPLLKHRFTMLGKTEPLPLHHEPGYQSFADCFFAKHPDAKNWEDLGGHMFRFYRFRPSKIHYVGGFGDSHYIGPIGMDDWAAAPSSPQCMAWAPECPAESEKRCCPSNQDNKFDDCCRK